MPTQELSPIIFNNAFLIVYLHVHLTSEPNFNILFACDFIAHPFISMLNLKSQPPELCTRINCMVRYNVIVAVVH